MAEKKLPKTTRGGDEKAQDVSKKTTCTFW